MISPPGDTNTASIWITGPDRSGTTLLYALLAAHPKISMVRRTNMWRWFYARFGDLALTENLEACLDAMASYQRMSVLQPDIERIRREFSMGSPTYGRLFALFHEHRAQRLGVTRWGDKSLHTEHYAEEVFAEFPNARIIHMLRDPRDRHASVTRRYEGRAKGAGSVTGRWIASTRAGEKNQARHPDGYMLMRYEDLARTPEAALQRACEFIGVSYDSRMLAMDADPDHEDGNSSFESLDRGTISTRSIGRFRTVLGTGDVAQIQALTGRWMKRHGYAKVEVEQSLPEQVRFRTIELPENVVRVGGWIIQDARRRRRGESIPVHRLTRPLEKT